MGGREEGGGRNTFVFFQRLDFGRLFGFRFSVHSLGWKTWFGLGGWKRRMGGMYMIAFVLLEEKEREGGKRKRDDASTGFRLRPAVSTKLTSRGYGLRGS